MSNLYGERYVPGQKDDPFFLEHIQRYQFSKPFIKNKKVLDLGCGTGYGSFELINLGAKQVYAVDIDKQAISFAKRHFQAKNLFFQQASATSLLFPDQSFEIVVSFEVIEHIKDYQSYLKEVFRVLKSQGIFIFSTPNKEQYRKGTSAYHFKEFSAQELKKLLPKAGFKVRLFGQFFGNKEFRQAQSTYFKRYQILTLGGKKTLKKMLNLFSPQFKASIYKAFFKVAPAISPDQIYIKKGGLDQALTLIGVCQKIN
ncbi:class I SAM-dependent methyltransferase [Candidatus Daviesbacteria bacterium]|nr:class I SAM-dependent methyltransferase [Candidatus Daviesbacteria bacterium]